MSDELDEVLPETPTEDLPVEFVSAEEHCKYWRQLAEAALDIRIEDDSMDPVEIMTLGGAVMFDHWFQQRRFHTEGLFAQDPLAAAKQLTRPEKLMLRRKILGR